MFRNIDKLDGFVSRLYERKRISLSNYELHTMNLVRIGTGSFKDEKLFLKRDKYTKRQFWTSRLLCLTSRRFIGMASLNLVLHCDDTIITSMALNLWRWQCLIHRTENPLNLYAAIQLSCGSTHALLIIDIAIILFAVCINNSISE